MITSSGKINLAWPIVSNMSDMIFKKQKKNKQKTKAKE